MSQFPRTYLGKQYEVIYNKCRLFTLETGTKNYLNEKFV
jgi:hypothetical protein